MAHVQGEPDGGPARLTGQPGGEGLPLDGPLQDGEPRGAAPGPQDVAVLLQALADSMTPGILERLAGLAAQAAILGDELVHTGGPLASAAVRAGRDAARQLRATPGAPGLAQLLRLARDPDTRRGLAFLLAFVRELGRRLGEPRAGAQRQGDGTRAQGPPSEGGAGIVSKV